MTYNVAWDPLLAPTDDVDEEPMPPRRKVATGPTPVEDLRHEDTRANGGPLM